MFSKISCRFQSNTLTTGCYLRLNSIFQYIGIQEVFQFWIFYLISNWCSANHQTCGHKSMCLVFVFHSCLTWCSSSVTEITEVSLISSLIPTLIITHINGLHHNSMHQTCFCILVAVKWWVTAPVCLRGHWIPTVLPQSAWVCFKICASMTAV